MLRMGSGDAGETRAPRAVGQSSRSRVTGKTSSCAGSSGRGIRLLVTHIAQGRGSQGRCPAVAVALGAIGGKGSGRYGHVPVLAGISQARQKGYGVRRGVGAMAKGGVVAAGLSARRRRGSRMSHWIVGGAWVVALSAHGGIGWVRGGMRVDRST
jgi:hypothetical protein